MGQMRAAFRCLRQPKNAFHVASVAAMTSCILFYLLTGAFFPGINGGSLSLYSFIALSCALVACLAVAASIPRIGSCCSSEHLNRKLSTPVALKACGFLILAAVCVGSMGLSGAAAISPLSSMIVGLAFGIAFGLFVLSRTSDFKRGIDPRCSYLGCVAGFALFAAISALTPDARLVAATLVLDLVAFALDIVSVVVDCKHKPGAAAAASPDDAGSVVLKPQVSSAEIDAKPFVLAFVLGFWRRWSTIYIPCRLDIRKAVRPL